MSETTQFEPPKPCEHGHKDGSEWCHTCLWHERNAVRNERDKLRADLKLAVEGLGDAEKHYVFKWGDSRRCSVLTPLRETLAKLRGNSDE
jgi:hypothetical protein